MFKPYQAVMVLSLRNGIGNYYDTRGTYIQLATAGSVQGKHKIEVNSTTIHVELNRLMDHDSYFKMYNEDKSKLPPEACGLLHFVEKG